MSFHISFSEIRVVIGKIEHLLAIGLDNLFQGHEVAYFFLYSGNRYGVGNGLTVPVSVSIRSGKHSSGILEYENDSRPEYPTGPSVDCIAQGFVTGAGGTVISRY
jgi:hypothetical protein